MKWLGITVLFLGLVSLVQRIFIKIDSLFIVTNYRVILKTGVISRRVRELVHTKVEGLIVTQSVAGRLFGYGTLLVTTGGAINTYHFVADPMRFKMEVNSAIEACRSR
nr:PH domain-containing protein [Parabacteroides sp. W1-Q-101]